MVDSTSCTVSNADATATPSTSGAPHRGITYDAAVELCERLGLTLPLLEKSGTEEEERVAKEPIVA